MEEEDLFNFEEVESSEAPAEGSIYDQEESYEDSEFSNEKEGDFVSKLLESKGIQDRVIQVTGEDGRLQNINFDDLSDQEKYDLLAEKDEPVLPTDDEIQMINYLRQNGMSFQDFANWQRRLGAQDYVSEQVPISDIDGYSDDEIIAYDFIQRFGEDMSDEEIDEEIDRLKADPEAFQKRADLVRAAYRNEEEAQARLYQQQEEQRSLADVENFKNAYIDAARNFNYIQGIDIDNNDKEELLNFVLTKDAAGRTGFSKALDDPEAVLRMAWGLLYGENAFEATSKYYRDQISQRGGTRVVSRQRTQPTDAFKF